MEEKDCEECKEWEEHHYWEHVDARGKLFFRVMVDDFSQSLKIPKKFLNLMGEELPEIVNLKDPSGIIWHVELENTSDGASFQSSWKDFAVAHHLAENDLLLFEYDGNSCFRVKILEGSGCEKAHSHCLKIKNSLKRGTSEDSEEVLDVTPRRKVNVSSSSRSSHDDVLHGQRISSPRKMLGNQSKPNKNQRIESKCRKEISRSNELPVHEFYTRGNTSKRVDTSKDMRCRIKQECDSLHGNDNLPDIEDICITRKASLTTEEERRVSRLANEVCSGKPYFISIMRPTCIRGSCLTVPVDFKVFLPLQNCEIVLQVPGMKKKWHVCYSTDKVISRFSDWKQFVRDNGLREGDICLFELINRRRDNIEMIVRIRRMTEDSSLFLGQSRPRQSDRMLKSH